MNPFEMMSDEQIEMYMEQLLGKKMDEVKAGYREMIDYWGMPVPDGLKNHMSEVLSMSDLVQAFFAMCPGSENITYSLDFTKYPVLQNFIVLLCAKTDKTPEEILVECLTQDFLAQVCLLGITNKMCETAVNELGRNDVNYKMVDPKVRLRDVKQFGYLTTAAFIRGEDMKRMFHVSDEEQKAAYSLEAVSSLFLCVYAEYNGIDVLGLGEDEMKKWMQLRE